MKTIQIPKNLHYLTDRLPKPNYTPLKTKKMEKYQFLQTLAGYKDPSLIQSKQIEKPKKSSDYKESSRKNAKIINMLPPLEKDRKR